MGVVFYLGCMIIVATIGINSFSEDKIRKIILSGVDIIRYNFSYRILDDKIQSLELLERIKIDLNSSTKLMIDMPSNKIRLGDFSNRIFSVSEGDEITLHSGSFSPDCHEFIPVEIVKLGEQVYFNQAITIGDGEMALEVIEIIDPETIKVRALNNGVIKYMKTFNIKQSLDDEKYLEYFQNIIDKIKNNPPTYIAISYINQRINEELKKVILNSLNNVKIIIKIEKELDKTTLESICLDNFYNMILLDRGELGVNSPYERCGIIQKEVIETAKFFKKQILVSTQLLESTTNNFTPNRSEIINLTQLVLDGADGIIFCHESTVGLRPSYSIAVAKKIINEVEKFKKESKQESKKNIEKFQLPSLFVANYQNLPSLTEWLEKIKSPNLSEFKQEDNTKFERLNKLHDVIKIPFDKPIQIEAMEAYSNTAKWQEVIRIKNGEICAIKLMPKHLGLPKYRAIGQTLPEYIANWLPQYKHLDHNNYYVEVLRHNPDMKYSSLFLINDFGIWGDFIEGVHWQLTHGVHEKNSTTFYYDFNRLWFYNEKNLPPSDETRYLINTAIKNLQVLNPQQQDKLENELGAEFTIHGYLKGYFEFFHWTDVGMKFNDYNRVIYKRLKDLKLCITDTEMHLRGLCANPGKITGKVQIIYDPKTQTLEEGAIIICKSIDLSHLSLLEKSAAIITEQGNILSHLAIISRELNKPCIVSVKNVTTKLKNGDMVRIDASKGIIELIV